MKFSRLLLLLQLSVVFFMSPSWAFLQGFSSEPAGTNRLSLLIQNDHRNTPRPFAPKIVQKFRLQSSSTSSRPGTFDLDFDWQAIARGAFEKDDRPIILFDGICNLCNGGVNFALDHDTVGNFRFASLQSKVGQALLIRSGKQPDDISSIVLVTPKEAYFKSDAVMRIAAKLEGNPLLPFMGKVGPFIPRFVRNFVYDFVAKNRYRFGEADQCRMDFDNEYGNRFVEDTL